MGILKGKKIYLAGPMEFDEKEDWRSPVIYKLMTEFQLDIYDPSKDEKQILLEQVQEAREKSDCDKLEEIAKTFTKKDFGTIDRSDLVVAYHPRGIATTGTPCEVKHSLDLKKPTFVICPNGKVWASLWYFGLMKHQYIFGSWEDFYSYLREVCEGKHNGNHRWKFVLGLV